MKRLLKTLIVLLILGLLGVFSLIGIFFIVSLDLPQINSLKDYNPPKSSRILSKDGEVLLELGLENRDVVEFQDIPPKVVSAFLAAEDDNFFNHKGVDYYGILRAFIVNLREGKLVQGGSTITQQVAKSFLLTRERTITRKIKDLLLARKIEQKLNKEEILYLYLNQVYLGGGYYGVKAAFRGYFDKDLEEATIAESALVAGLLVAPGRYSPYVNPRYAKMRQSYVLKRLYETNKISQEEYEAALAEDIKMRIRKPNPIKGGHFTDWVRQEVVKVVGKDEFLTEGYEVVTTLDWELQQKAEKSVRENIKELDKRQGFKGPLKHFATEEEMTEQIIAYRHKLLKDNSQFFTFSTEGKNIYEYQETDEDSLEKLAHFQRALEEVPEKARRLVDIGNTAEDPVNDFIEVGSTHPAIVIKTDDAKKVIIVSIGGVRGVIPHKGFEWAHPRNISESPQYHPKPNQPSRLLKVGDQVLVKVERKSVPYQQLVDDSFIKRYEKDSNLSLVLRERFHELSLDQEPEAEGAMIALNPYNGEIISLVGGVNFDKSQFNRAIQSSRQVGSAFKPFIYAAALENGMTPSTILMDTPQALGGVDDSLSWKPRNYDGAFKGPMTLRSALEVSRNIPTVRLVQDLGVQKIHDFIRRLHINAEIPKDMSLSLGSFGISLAELTKGYAIFANGGKAIRLKHITSITDRNGEAIPVPAADPDWVLPKEETTPAPEVVQTPPMPEEGELITDPVFENPFTKDLGPIQVYDRRLAYIMTNLLNGVTLHGTGRRVNKVSKNLAAKTGTTNNYVDAIFVGYSNHAVVGTWAGFDDNRTLGFAETGAKTTLPIFSEYMEAIIDKFGDTPFTAPPGITTVMVDKETGKPISSGSLDGFLESFVTGTEPEAEDPIFDRKDQSIETGVEDDEYFKNL
ncbi:MAG: PBP1A family penicillin-binding protein [Candidatus Caldatribacteriota bacterium]